MGMRLRDSGIERSRVITLFRHYRNRGIFSKGEWHGEYMLVGKSVNYILRQFKCSDCGPQWFAWKWIVCPGAGPWFGPAKTRAALVQFIQKRERPDLRII